MDFSLEWPVANVPAKWQGCRPILPQGWCIHILCFGENGKTSIFGAGWMNERGYSTVCTVVICWETDRGAGGDGYLAADAATRREQLLRRCRLDARVRSREDRQAVNTLQCYLIVRTAGAAWHFHSYRNQVVIQAEALLFRQCTWQVPLLQERSCNPD